MKRENLKIFSVRVSVCLFSLFFGITSCTRETQYKVLSFVFDGVPDFTKSKEVNLNDSIAKIGHNEQEILLAENLNFSKHSPFREKNCSGCHDPQVFGKLVDDIPKLCFNCHSEYFEQYTVTHGPSGAGECMICHEPHSSKFPHLQRFDGQGVCLNCHDKDLILQSKFHGSIEDQACSNCHDPHGGEAKSFLKNLSCNECHSDIQTKYSNMHGPVAAGYCTVCHDSHNSEANGLLLRVGQDLCLFCHSRSLIDKDTHEGIGKEDCTMCHHPHGSSEKYLLN